MIIFRLAAITAIFLASLSCAWADNDPSKRADLLDRGVGLMVKKKFPEAIEIFDEIISANPKCDQAYYALCNRGDAYCLQGLDDKAQKDFDRAVELAPDKESAYLHRASLYEKTAHQEKAASDLSKAITILQKQKSGSFPNAFLAGIFQERADVYKAMGQKALQEKDLASAAALNKH